MVLQALRRQTVTPLVVAIAFAAACGHAGPRTLTLATTTSVGNSGLLEVLQPAFQHEHSIVVRAHLVGSGRALAMLGDGTADIAITHAPDAETGALAAHPSWRYTKIMFNDFVLVGPTADPSRVKGAGSVLEAMRRIAAGPARFISRADGSGTHEREQSLWKLAGAAPAPGQLVGAGSGMGTTLKVASETGAYTLSDRATFVQNEGSLHSIIVFEGGPELLNTYAVVENPQGQNAGAAHAFAQWLIDGHGRELIASYEVAGRIRGFNVWPKDRPGSSPRDRPW